MTFFPLQTAFFIDKFINNYLDRNQLISKKPYSLLYKSNILMVLFIVIFDLFSSKVHLIHSTFLVLFALNSDMPQEELYFSTYFSLLMSILCNESSIFKRAKVCQFSYSTIQGKAQARDM